MRARVRPDVFEAMYRADPDPWDFASSDYERGKYDATIAAVAHRRWPAAFEPGCSIGVLSERLAAHCDALLACEVSETALAHARARLTGHAHVSVQRREIPEELPKRRFDLVVCSEVLYYLDAPAFAATVARLDDLVAPGGSLLAVHWRRPTATHPLHGEEVHAGLAALGWPAGAHAVTASYVLHRWDRPDE
jgi:SAM-dependent methyltransferase